MTRRSFLLGAWIPFFSFFRRSISIGGQKFRIIRRGEDWRHYLWIHGNEQTAKQVLVEHMKTHDGRAFLVENDKRNIPIQGGVIDPNRMFSSIGAEKNLRKLNPNWSGAQVQSALKKLDRDRGHFLKMVLPKPGQLLIVLHNNSEGYSVQDEVPISERASLNNPEHPHEFILCSYKPDFDMLAGLPLNVVLQSKPGGEDDGSLSRVAAARGLRYINIECGLGKAEEQRRMLETVERVL